MGNADKKSTPGRPKKKGTQYWDVGKVGRKTGITLPDQGVRDEHGLEPVSHIFTSPVSPRREALDSSDVHMHESSGPDLDVTLASRKTPRLPPARASTPKHTNIGSPKRGSTGRTTAPRLSTGTEGIGSAVVARSQRRPNRILDFGENEVRQSIEKSPFKPRHVLRRSTGLGEEHPFSSARKVVAGVEVTPFEEREDVADHDSDQEAVGGDEREEGTIESDAREEIVDDEERDEKPYVDDGPILLDDDDYEGVNAGQQESGAHEVVDEEPDAEAETLERSNSQHMRKSRGSLNNSTTQHAISPVASSSSHRKRDLSTLAGSDGEEPDVSHSRINESGRAHKKQRSTRTSDSRVVVHQDEEQEATLDPAILSNGYDDDAVDDDAGEESEEPVQKRAKGKGKAKNSKAPKERDPNRAMRAQSSQVPIHDSPSKLRERRDSSRSLSVGPISNVALRASTPFEDAGRTSRYGRNLLQPLKYWANEMRIYKHGETQGIVRATPVSPKKRRRAPAKKKTKKRKGGLNDIDEESEAESVLPDDWEEDFGVIAGEVANWDPETQQGDPGDLVREDLAFAATSIVTKDIANTTFKYAKIMTLPFFGGGLVELPPQGEKRAKNCRKMHMCFFVHEGKVMVEVFAGGDSEQVHQFAISKGGAFVVPRGNNYSILNESRSRTAKIFFAQGCEVHEMQK